MTSRDCTNTDFISQWADCFGPTPPLGHLLRTSTPDRWGRLHALPEGKRYARNRQEQAEILGRANSIASSIFEENAQVWLVVPRFSKPTDTTPAAGHDLGFSHSWENPQDPEYRCHFYAGEIQWKTGALDSTFMDIAEDRTRATLFSTKNKTALAPYDGGFDVFSNHITAVKERFSDWRPAGPSGL